MDLPISDTWSLYICIRTSSSVFDNFALIHKVSPSSEIASAVLTRDLSQFLSSEIVKKYVPSENFIRDKGTTSHIRWCDHNDNEEDGIYYFYITDFA